MNGLFSAAAEIQQACQDKEWKFCFIGGLATIRWGEPRLTHDVDLTILASFGDEEPVVDGLLDQFAARLDDARQFAIQHRVLLLRAGNNIPIDVALGALDFEERTVERASEWNVGEVGLITCSAEDLIIHKVFAGRDRDWADVEGVISRQRGSLDCGLILSELVPLLEAKGTSVDLDRIRGLVEEHL